MPPTTLGRQRAGNLAHGHSTVPVLHHLPHTVERLAHGFPVCERNICGGFSVIPFYNNPGGVRVAIEADLEPRTQKKL